MRSFYRTASFFTTWSAEILRQPAMMASLVLGPFIILFAFGQGVDITRIEPKVIVVQDIAEEHELQPLPEELDDYVDVVDVTRDLGDARERLRQGDVDGVAVIPDDPVGTIEDGEHVPLRVLTSDIDPLRRRLTEGYLNEQVAALNQDAIANTIADAQQSFSDVEEHIQTARGYIETARSARGEIDDVRQWVTEFNEVLGPVLGASEALGAAVSSVPFLILGLEFTRDEVRQLQGSLDDLAARVDSLDQQLNSEEDPSLPSDAELAAMDEDLEATGQRLRGLPAEVLAAPFELDFDNIAPFVPTFAGFYAPAVLALLLQHLGISLAALSATRIKSKGLLDMLRITPARPGEVVTGNYLSFGFLLIVAAAIILGLMMIGLSVPVHGSWVLLAAVVLLLIAVSLGIGFVIAMISTSEKHAAQLAMLILLASVFFSGLVLSLDRIGWPMRGISYLLPSTYAIRSLQDIMLRGLLRTPLDLVVLGAAAVFFFVLTVLLMRRMFRTT